MDASVIVCTYNRAESLRDTLRTLKAQLTRSSFHFRKVMLTGYSGIKDWQYMLLSLLPPPDESTKP